MSHLTFWYDFASTYSYLSAVRIGEVASRTSVTVTWQPFLLGPIFGQQGWTTSPFNIFPAKGAYMWRDMDRQAAKLGLPRIKRPIEFPQNSLLAARIACCGKDEGWVDRFSLSIFQAQFQHGQNISDKAVLMDILTRMDLDAAEIMHRATSEQSIKDSLRAATKAAQDAGIFGAPSFVTRNGELFWGNDRLDDAIACALLE